MKTNIINDSHTHISMDFSLREDVKGFKWIMEETGTERIQFLALNAHPFFAETQLDNSKCLYLKSAFAPYGYAGYCLDYTRERTPDGFEKQISDARKAGFDCWKIIEAKPNSQKVWGYAMDDDIYERAFAFAEKNKFPIILHTGDPEVMWKNEYAEGYLTKAEYREQVERVLKRHPDLIMTIAHFGFMGSEPERVKDLLDTYKTLYFDLVPAPEEYFAISKKPEKWKNLFENYSDRFIFGTDRGNHGTDGFTREKWFKNYPETASYQKRLFLENGKCDGRHPFPGLEEHWGTEWYGLNISDKAYNDIFYNNFITIYGDPKPINYNMLYDYAKYEFSLPSKSKTLKEDFEEIKRECEKHGVTISKIGVA